MRRFVVAAVLVAAPVALVGWMVWRGQTYKRPELAETLRTPADEERALRAMFEAGLAPARLKGPVQLFNAETLFNAVDGAAPSFIERGFRRLATAPLALAPASVDGGGGAGGSELSAEVYDMRAAANAEAMLEAEASPSLKPVADWPQARSGAMALVFSAGRYYVKLTAFDAAAEAALPAVGRALERRLP